MTRVPFYGMYKRDAGEVCQAVYVEGRGAFQGPAASPQIYDAGAVIIRQGQRTWLIQPDCFEESYRHPDGSAVKAFDVAAARIKS